MLIDEPELSNTERLRLAADALEQGNIVNLCVMQNSRVQDEAYYRTWMKTILHNRRHSREDAEALVCGLYIILENVGVLKYDEDDGAWA